jgi:tRNA A-37 threonylcarbamoyl transferase component Bud32/tetratricopeptide (TPR) repeat protein
VTSGAASSGAPWAVIEPLLDRALELPATEQDALLEQTRASDPALAAELARLVYAGRCVGGFLEEEAAVYAEPLLTWAAEREPLEPSAMLGRYEIIRRLGRGATATVYLARDEKHHRTVAVKVLHPELTEALGSDRFLREIEIAATLHHPHILPLFDSGSADGLLYYVMPHVEGESLRIRLSDDRPVPVVDALRIAREVAEALDYSHRHGVVHRDIKPENILLQDGQAIVADFGIARAIDVASDGVGEGLRGTGTPAYMSPEQATPNAVVDGRADIYALGCVVYEMLCGRPPFEGTSPQEILAHHVHTPVPQLAPPGLDLPSGVDGAVHRALAKHPADRFATAAEFGHALVAVPAAGVVAGGASVPGSSIQQKRHRNRLALFGLTSAVVLAFVAVRSRSLSVTNALALRLDPHLVAVLPFRVSSADPGLSYLQDGLSELLAVQLTGEGGPRAVEPRAVANAWRQRSSAGRALGPRVAIQVARDLGAGRLVDGGVAGGQGHVVVTASVLDASSGRTIGRASAEGPVDSLGVLVARLAAQVLAADAGESRQLATLDAVPLSALRAYLDGQAALRQGRWSQSMQHFGRALDIDSTFAQAAMGLAEAGSWDVVGDHGRGNRLAAAYRTRLSPGDRAMLTALVGPRFPDLSSNAETLAAAEAAVQALPDRPQAWFRLGDLYWHWGAALGIPRSRELAAAAFRRAIALDSSITHTSPSAEPLVHLFQIAAIEGDTATVRRLGASGIARDTVPGFFQWRMAWVFHDSAALGTLRRHFDVMSDGALTGIITRSIEDGLPMDDADHAVAVLVARAGTREEQVTAEMYRYAVVMHEGRPKEGAAGAPARSPEFKLLRGVGGELYWDGDSAAGAAAVREVSAHADAPLVTSAKDRGGQYWDICWVERWRVAHGQLGTVRRAMARLRSRLPPGLDPAGATWTNDFGSLCADLLEATVATIERQPNAGSLAHRLDARLRQMSPGWNIPDNLVAAHLLEANGDVPRALAAVRRRLFDMVPSTLSTYLREEGRLAALMGDTAGAIAAYRHYLTLQAHPEPTVAPHVAEARAALDRLLATRQQ